MGKLGEKIQCGRDRNLETSLLSNPTPIATPLTINRRADFLLTW